MSNAAVIIVTGALTAFSADRREEVDLDDLLADAIARYDWPEVREALFHVLESTDSELWPHAVAGLWGAILDGREIDPDRTIALTYYRLSNSASELDKNLIWSIASKLKNVGYLSDYDPLADPKVREHMERLHR